MSFHTWHNYGYGICVDDIPTPSSEQLFALLRLAPVFEQKVHEYLSECGITDPSAEDYFAYDDDYGYGLATFMREVIEEAEKITLMACDDFEGQIYLLFQPAYPWEMTDRESAMTEKAIEQIFRKDTAIITDRKIGVDYHDPENGG